jgi:hypothetical protein
VQAGRHEYTNKVNVISLLLLIYNSYTTLEKKTLILRVDGLVGMKKKKETLEHCSCSVKPEIVFYIGYLASLFC